MNKLINKPSLFLLLGLLLLAQFTFGQAYKLKSAREHFASGNYVLALEIFRELLVKEPENTYYLAKLAECYKNLAQYKKAEIAYSKILNSQDLPEDYYLNYAKVLANNRKYKQSKLMYEMYAKLKKDELAERTALKYDNVESFYANSNKFKIGMISINSSLSDFSPCFYNQGLVFVSNRKPPLLNRNLDGRDETPFSDYYFLRDTSKIYVEPIRNSNMWNIEFVGNEYRNADMTKETANDSKTVGSVQNVFDDTSRIIKCLVHTPVSSFSAVLNTASHEGPLTFNSTYDTVYFTRNVEPNKKHKFAKFKSPQLRIFIAVLELGKWKEIGEFPFNGDDFSCGHPSLSIDGKTLYFTSNMAGGYGGTDIYKTELKNGFWNAPKNLGSNVNTRGNELFPFVDQSNNLFFASDGHPGLGGLDIFQTEYDEKFSLPIKNLGNPINSSLDDFGLIYDNERNRGYFSSNRIRGIYDDDIYHFSYYSNEQSVIVRGHIYEKDTKNGVNKSMIYLQNGNDIDSSVTDINGYYIFPIETNKQYTIKATRKGFTESEISISTQKLKKGLLQTIIIDTNLYLVKLPQEELALEDEALRNALKNNKLLPQYVCDTLGDEFKLGNIYYDINKYYIRSADQPSLLKVIKLMTKYKDSQLIISSSADSKNSSEYNILLAKKRALTVYYSLISRGIRKERINYEFKNNSVEIESEKQTEKNQYSRRTEFFIIVRGVNVTKGCNLVPGPNSPIPKEKKQIENKDEGEK